MRTLSVRCLGCKRAFTLAIEVLAANRPCQVCGGAIEMTPAVMEEIRSFNEARVAQGYRMPFKIECPICSRPMEVEPKSEVACQFCGCKFFAESASKPAEVRMAMPPEDPTPIAIDCPACGAGMTLAGDARGGEAGCGKCQARFNPHQKPLEHLMLVPPPGLVNADLATGLAMDATRRRWGAADAPFGEVIDLVSNLQLVCSDGGIQLAASGRGCPLPPRLAAELLMYSVYHNSGGVIDTPNPVAATLKMPLPEEQVPEGMDALAWGAVAGIAMGAVGVMAIPAMGKRGRDADSKRKAQWYIRIDLTLHGSGSSWVVGVQDPNGNFKPPPLDKQGDIYSRLGPVVLYAARKLVCFRALFGRWASAQLLECLSPKAVARRLREIDPAWAPHADALGVRFVAYPRPA